MILNFKIVKRAIVVALLIGSFPLGLTLFFIVMNADLYGRLTETQTASGVGNPNASSNEAPTVRLVLHKLPADENAVEASLLLEVPGGTLTKLIREGKARVTAYIRDGSNFQPYAIQYAVTLDSTTVYTETGVYPLAVQSERFLLPAFPNLGGFPFDDLVVRPIIHVWRDEYYTRQFRFEVQKALPGRLMHLSDDNITMIRLTRSPTEKALVITSSVVFLFLSSILAYGLFTSPRGLTHLEELLAVGGYLIAAAGFRDLLGLSRTAGTSALEIAIIGVPLLTLAFGIAVSFIRGRLQAHRKSGHEVSGDPMVNSDAK
ncbi:MAG: hypothetical protein ILNGONEN_00817 [Syntrophorhabdaceae bacterium]|nr:hypothetical protein [Syntrophorhabdaceae bacterium]